MPTVLLCVTTLDTPIGPYADAATRAGVTLRVVSTLGDRLDGRSREGEIPVALGPDGTFAADAIDTIAGTDVDGVLAVDDHAARLAAQIAQAARVPWHAPDAVHVATDPLLTRGRLLAAGAAMPWFVTLPVHGHEGFDRMSRVRFPCVVTSLGASTMTGARRVDTYEALLAERARMAARHPASDVASSAAPLLLVEGFIPGREFVLEGVLELGALRVFALFERPGPGDGPSFEPGMLVTPARLPSSRQQVLAGHVARAALALGLHHGPVHAWCRVDGEQVVVPGVAPRPLVGAGARAVPVIDPDGARVGLEDVLIAHALGRPLDGFGHEAVARGVLQLTVPESGRLLAVDGVDEVASLPRVTAVQLTATVGDDLDPYVDGGTSPGYIVAEAPQPGDVVEALHEAERRVQLRVGP